MSINSPGTLRGLFSPSALLAQKPNTTTAQMSMHSSSDTFSKSKQPMPTGPRFSGWGDVLTFTTAGLTFMRNRVDRSIERDAERAERRAYERRKHERYEKLGRSYRESDGRGYYRTVTPITLKDGNGKTLDRYHRVSNWRRSERY